LQPAQYYQPSSIRAAMDLWQTLNAQRSFQRDFIEFIFKLLLSDNINAIDIGFEALMITKPKYDDYKAYYEDLKNIAETEQNEEVKQIRVQYFEKLRKISGDDSKWWEWLSSYEIEAEE
jgi:hypothetical protein